MSSDFSEMDLVGARVHCTMVTPESPGSAPQPSAALVPDVIEGTVYSFNPAAGVLVLMTDFGGERSSFRMLNLSYIEDISLVSDVKSGAPEHALPPGIASYVTLPALQNDAGENLERKVLSKKKNGEDSRKYDGVDDDISIRALEVLDSLARVYPDARWDDQRNCIAVGDNITVVGNPSWNKPKVKGPAESVTRIQRILEHKK